MKLKDKLFLSPKLEVRSTGFRSFSVFCNEKIKKNELIEESPLILLSNNEFEQCDAELRKYIFPWTELKTNWEDFCDKNDGILYEHAARPVVVLGYGMLYNNSNSYNTTFYIDQHRFTCVYKAIRDIEAGSEITINNIIQKHDK